MDETASRRQIRRRFRSFRAPAAVAVWGAILAAASTTAAQTPPQPEPTILEQSVKVIAGGALGLAIHEAGHVVVDVAVGAPPGVKRISYGGIPFFAITHDAVGPTSEFAISSAGFWMQHLSSEWLLSRRPNLRHERAPVAKGILAFNVLVSVMYAGAALGRIGPPERDTRGMAVSANVREPWIAPVILAPAALDAVRYFKPESRVARWGSRAAKIGGMLLILRAQS